MSKKTIFRKSYEGFLLYFFILTMVSKGDNIFAIFLGSLIANTLRFVVELFIEYLSKRKREKRKKSINKRLYN